MKVLLLVGYGIITLISSAVYIMSYHTIFARFNMFVILSTIPGLSNGTVSGIPCHNMFECAHYTCKNDEPFIPQPTTDCDMTGNAMYSRYPHQSVEMDVNLTFYVVIANLCIGMFLSVMLPIVTFTVKNVPDIANAITVFIIIMSNIITSMFIIYMNIILLDIRPYTPTFYAYIDTNVSEWQISIIIVNLLVIMVTLSYLVIQINTIEEDDITDAIMFFTKHRPQSVSDLDTNQMFLTEDFFTDCDEDQSDV